MKLIITYYGLKSKELWSGTIDILERLLSQHKSVSSISSLGIFPDMTEIYRKLVVLYARLFYRSDGICRERQMYYKTLRKAKKGLNSKQADWVVMIAEHCMTADFDKSKKYACYIDTDFPMMAALDANRGKPGYNYYLRNYDKYTRTSYENMDLIFTQNEWTRLSIIDRFQLDPKKVKNIRFGVNIKPLQEEKDYSKDLLLIVLRPFNAKVKGLDILIEALPIIRESNPNVRLAVVGNDTYKDVEGVDTYVGFPREKTQELFRDATLYVMPSRSEPNGITYLEALCSKAPFVALNRFATKEFSNNGEWSFLCESESPQELADKVLEALSDKKRLKEMGEKGQKFVVDNYKWEKVVDDMCNYMQGGL